MLEFFQSWSEIYITILITIAEVSILVMVYAVFRVLSRLGKHPTFKSLMKEADDYAKGKPIRTGNPGDLEKALEEDLDEEGN